MATPPNPRAAAGDPIAVGGAAAAAAAPAPRRPSPDTTGVEEFLTLLVTEHDECSVLIGSIQRIVDAGTWVPIRVNSVVHMYQRAANGTLMRAPASAVFTSRVFAAEVAPADVFLPVEPTDTIPVFSLVHTPVTRRAADMLAEWTAPADCIVTAIEDPWGKPCDYTFKSFGDAMRLVPIMLSYSSHYRMLADNGATRGELHKFWSNYDSIHRALAGLHTLLSGVKPHIDLNAAHRRIDALNATMASMAAGASGVYTSPPVTPALPPIATPLIDACVPPHVAAAAASLLEAHLTSRGLHPSTGFTLLYSGARDGMTSTAYHSRVDGQPRLLTLICGDGYWFGGYTNAAPTATNGEWTFDPHACLMTITNPHGIAPTTYPVEEDPEKAGHAKHAYASHGPCFGAGCDLAVCGPDLESTTYCGFPSSFVDSTGKGNVTFTGKQSGWRVTAIIVVQV